jgi:hypothetical protein
LGVQQDRRHKIDDENTGLHNVREKIGLGQPHRAEG